MLTGIYVYTQTTLMFNTSETGTLTAIDGGAPQTVGAPPNASVPVGKGVYKLETNATVNLSFANASDGSFFECPSPECPSLKDSPPNPPPVKAQELCSDQTKLNTFFGHDAAKDEGFPTAAAAV